MFEFTVRNGVLQARRGGTRWLSSGWGGGYVDADAAYNVSVPEGFERTDLDAYIGERRRGAGFERAGPTLLTGVDLRHACGARCDAVEAVVTAGISNPAALPTSGDDEGPSTEAESGEWTPGTVNVLLGTSRAVDDGSLATLMSVAVEAKTATMLSETGFPGTTTDAVIVASDPDGEAATFAGSGTPIGAAARASVRDAVQESLRSRYAATDPPESVEAADHGVRTDRRTETFEP
ncbi:adenosylcobinamide amidohydrolase [halophilic archaeon]|nr:adenosylcobinamide amidohydrolase [halophilic archaeon]